jgi:hypothetical protein
MPSPTRRPQDATALKKEMYFSRLRTAFRCRPRAVQGGPETSEEELEHEPPLLRGAPGAVASHSI